MSISAKLFLLTPLREGRRVSKLGRPASANFYSRPCGRGDSQHAPPVPPLVGISTHAPAGGATRLPHIYNTARRLFLLTPLREGRRETGGRNQQPGNQFLLTPLREGRLRDRAVVGHGALISTHAPAGGATRPHRRYERGYGQISTHAPAGGATESSAVFSISEVFLLTPLREGRQRWYCVVTIQNVFLLTPLREGRRYRP